MTKTNIPAESRCFIIRDLSEIMPVAQSLMDYLFRILNFGHCDLFDIWFLVLGIFTATIKQEIFAKSINSVIK